MAKRVSKKSAIETSNFSRRDPLMPPRTTELMRELEGRSAYEVAQILAEFHEAVYSCLIDLECRCNTEESMSSLAPLVKNARQSSTRDDTSPLVKAIYDLHEREM